MSSILLLSNCQSVGLAASLRSICQDVRVDSIHLRPNDFEKHSKIRSSFKGYDYVVSLPYKGDAWGPLVADEVADEGVLFIPNIVFTGYHPDCIYVNGKSGPIGSPIGAYHSSIVYLSYINKLTEADVLKLFDADVFEMIGYYSRFSEASRLLKSILNDSGFDGELLIQKWRISGPFMHTINHPKIFVLADIAKALASRMGLKALNSDVAGLVPDNLVSGAIFPIYPGVEGSNSSVFYDCAFKRSSEVASNLKKDSAVVSLKQFIRESYAIYRNISSNDMENVDESSRNVDFLEACEEVLSGKRTGHYNNPYKELPDYHYWKRSVARADSKNMSPLVNVKYRIEENDKVATAGSCFAQHISRTLNTHGLNYFITEKGPVGLSAQSKAELGYGLFSARYGNIYTPMQLVQLFKRAYGDFNPIDDYWVTAEGLYLDSFRPNVNPSGYSSLSSLYEDRSEHLSAVRRMFEELDVFVFTLGLTESWINLNDSTVYPVAPGVMSVHEDTCRYRFINFSYNDVVRDLVTFTELLRAVNNEAKIILTVSPVPLIATYERNHVLQSNTYSKSVLRAAAEFVSKSFSNISYFPSYEIIVGGYNKGVYYDDDLRSVTPDGVEHVMKVFIKHCTTVGGNAPCSHENTGTDVGVSQVTADELRELSEVVCDEELLDPTDT